MSAEGRDLDEEIAQLRVIIHEYTEDPQIVYRAIALLTKAVAIRHGLSKEQEAGLYQDVLALLCGQASTQEGRQDG